MTFKNVGENWLLYDTVAVYNDAAASFSNPAGWFGSFAAMGAANEINFFNVRNREIGLPYNNQDSRDQMAYGYELYSIGVSFFANTITSAAGWFVDQNFSPDDQTGHLFMSDLPRHAALTLRVQQDDRLKSNVLMAPAGYGPFGDGYGRGAPSTLPNAINGYDHHASVVTQGVPEKDARWKFPKPIMIPRRATINVRIQFNEYAKQMLAVMFNNWEFMGLNDGDDDVDQEPIFAGIQVGLGGKRLIQQRAQYHV